jgi:hypothetical protein
MEIGCLESPNRRYLLTALAIAPLLALAMLAGCQPSQPLPAVVTQPAAAGIEVATEVPPSQPPRPSTGPELPPPPAAPTVEPLAEPNDGGTLVEETWDAFSLQGTRVGYAHTTVAMVEEGGQTLRRTRGATRTTLKRAGQTIVQDMLLTSWEKPGGEVVRSESRMKMGPADMVSRGRVEGDKLIIDTSTLGKTQSQTIPWPAGCGGFFAVEQSLRQPPLKVSEKRTVTGLMPVFNSVGTTELAASDYETVKLPGGEQKLLKVDSVIDLGGQKMDTVLWVNDKGETLKSLVPSIGQEAVRTTKEDALQKPAGGEFDLLVASVVKLAGELPSPHTTKRVVYRARVKNGKVEGVFPKCLSQQVLKEDEKSVELLVQAVRPEVVGTLHVPSGDDGARSVPTTGPTDDDLAANNMIQSDDPRIVAMAAKAAPPSADSWTTAVALEKYVSQSIRKKNFSQAFATAAEVAQSLEGDCTEHAVLLAALCRAKKIPARVAFGLVYYPPEQGFAYHMWNEVWIADRWIPLDGTLGLGGIGADHIKLGDSNLSGTTGLAAMLPVVQVFGRLELEVVSAE